MWALNNTKVSVPEAEGSGRALKKSPEWPKGRSEFRSEMRPDDNEEKGGGNERHCVSQTCACHWSITHILTGSSLDQRIWEQFKYGYFGRTWTQFLRLISDQETSWNHFCITRPLPLSSIQMGDSVRFLADSDIRNVSNPRPVIHCPLHCPLPMRCLWFVFLVFFQHHKSKQVSPAPRDPRKHSKMTFGEILC